MNYSLSCSFFFNDTATTEIYTLSLHDALPISAYGSLRIRSRWVSSAPSERPSRPRAPIRARSEEHTSELQSQSNLVCRLLLEKKNAPMKPSPPVAQRRVPHCRSSVKYSARSSN